MIIKLSDKIRSCLALFATWVLVFLASFFLPKHGRGGEWHTVLSGFAPPPSSVPCCVFKAVLVSSAVYSPSKEIRYSPRWVPWACLPVWKIIPAELWPRSGSDTRVWRSCFASSQLNFCALLPATKISRGRWTDWSLFVLFKNCFSSKGSLECF